MASGKQDTCRNNISSDTEAEPCEPGVQYHQGSVEAGHMVSEGGDGKRQLSLGVGISGRELGRPCDTQ